MTDSLKEEALGVMLFNLFIVSYTITGRTCRRARSRQIKAYIRAPDEGANQGYKGDLFEPLGEPPRLPEVVFPGKSPR